MFTCNFGAGTSEIGPKFDKLLIMISYYFPNFAQNFPDSRTPATLHTPGLHLAASSLASRKVKYSVEVEDPDAAAALVAIFSVGSKQEVHVLVFQKHNVSIHFFRAQAFEETLRKDRDCSAEKKTPMFIAW